jgi:hypothetical protein
VTLEEGQERKYCRTCMTWLPERDWFPSFWNDSRRNECRNCFNAKQRAKRRAAAGKSGPRFCRKCEAEISDRHLNAQFCGELRKLQFESDSGRLLERRRIIKYGLDAKAWAALLEFQDGVCPICLRDPMRPVTDHDHLTTEVRGILCDAHNRALVLSATPLMPPAASWRIWKVRQPGRISRSNRPMPAVPSAQTSDVCRCLSLNPRPASGVQ